MRELLNGVDLEGTRRRGRAERVHHEAIRLFISYSHKDEEMRERLQTHLTILERQELIAAWDDRRIGPGDEWGREINQSLERADLVLLLVSADFIASEYCEKEMKRALERHENREAQVIPIIVRHCNWKSAPFANLQALPKEGRAVTSWENEDEAWTDVSKGIEKKVRKIQKEAERLGGFA